MNIQSISLYNNNRIQKNNQPSFKNLIVEYPELLPSKSLNKIVRNKEIQVLTKLLDDEDKDLTVKCVGYDRVLLWATPKEQNGNLGEYLTYYKINRLKYLKSRYVIEKYRHNQELTAQEAEKIRQAEDFVAEFNAYLVNNKK